MDTFEYGLMLPPKEIVPKEELKEWAILNIKQQPFFVPIDGFFPFIEKYKTYYATFRPSAKIVVKRAVKQGAILFIKDQPYLISEAIKSVKHIEEYGV